MTNSLPLCPLTDPRYVQTTYQRTHTIPCYGSCQGASQDDITWCVNLFDHGESVELCLNSTWNNSTALATAAALLQHFHMPQVRVEDLLVKKRMHPLHFESVEYVVVFFLFFSWGRGVYKSHV